MSAAGPFMSIEKIDLQLGLWVRHLRKPTRNDRRLDIRGIIDNLLDKRLLVSELDHWWELEDGADTEPLSSG